MIDRGYIRQDFEWKIIKSGIGEVGAGFGILK
jgi:hypothetical protein